MEITVTDLLLRHRRSSLHPGDLDNNDRPKTSCIIPGTNNTPSFCITPSSPTINRFIKFTQSRSRSVESNNGNPSIPYTIPKTAPVARRSKSENSNGNQIYISNRKGYPRKLSSQDRTDSGMLNPSLYLSSSCGEGDPITMPNELFGKVYFISYFNKANKVLKLRLKKIKCESSEYYNTGIYVRLHLTHQPNETRQSSTQYGETRRIYNEDFYFTVEEENVSEVAVWGVLYESAAVPRVLSNFHRIIDLEKDSTILRCLLRHDSREVYTALDNNRIDLQIAIKYLESEGKISAIVYKCGLPTTFTDNSNSYYIKASFYRGDRLEETQRCRSSRNKKVVDFSKEFIFRVDKNCIHKYNLHLEFKRITGFRQKNHLFGVVKIGGEAESAGRLHWTRSIAQPGDRTYLTHYIYIN